MKRSFSLQEVQNAIDQQNSAKSSVCGPPTNWNGNSELTYHKATTFAHQLSLTSSGSMRRSKSMGDFEVHSGMILPSISQLGLTMGHACGSEDIKRGRGEQGKFTGSGCSSPRIAPSSPAIGTLSLHDEETLGAASALMQLFSSNPSKIAAVPQSSSSQQAGVMKGSIEGQGGNSVPFPSHANQPFKLTPAAGMLPSLSSILGGAPPMAFGSTQHTLSARVQHEQRPDFLRLTHQPQAPEGMHTHIPVQNLKTPFMSPSHRDPVSMNVEMPEQASDTGGDGEGKHNKYCHFCQHVKVKKASSMLACVNQECARRFCEHCLVSHLMDTVPADASDWKCPICRRICCCSIQSCSRQHRHCKAFRYRQRRAEQAAKRSQGNTQARAAIATATQAPVQVGNGNDTQTTHAAQTRIFPTSVVMPGEMQGSGMPGGALQSGIPVGGAQGWDRGGDSLGQAR